jgi:hypothetical protein
VKDCGGVVLTLELKADECKRLEKQKKTLEARSTN